MRFTIKNYIAENETGISTISFQWNIEKKKWANPYLECKNKEGENIFFSDVEDYIFGLRGDFEKYLLDGKVTDELRGFPLDLVEETLQNLEIAIIDPENIWNISKDEKEESFQTLQEVIRFVKRNPFSYGYNRVYHFVFDNDDGFLYFLKRNDKMSEHQKDLDRYNEIRNQWPENCYDGEVLFKQFIGKNADNAVISLLKDYFKVEIHM